MGGLASQIMLVGFLGRGDGLEVVAAGDHVEDFCADTPSK